MMNKNINGEDESQNIIDDDSFNNSLKMDNNHKINSNSSFNHLT